MVVPKYHSIEPGNLEDEARRFVQVPDLRTRECNVNKSHDDDSLDSLIF